MQIRRATPKDALSLQQLINEAFHRTTDAPICGSYFESSERLTLVASEGEKILATASIHFLQKLDRKMGQIEDVVVHSKAQGLGLGRQVVQALLTEAQSKECYKIVLNTAEKTAPFYEKMGFEKGELQMMKRK